MDSSRVIYEHPLNERTRMLLRLEFLFEQASHAMDDDSVWGCRRALANLLELLALLSRGDVKSEVHKELERQTLALGRLANREDVDSTRLQSALAKLHSMTARLHDEASQLGQYLKNNEFIAAVRSRSALPGGLCEFDVPAYHYWLEHSTDGRKQDLERWYDRLWVLRDAIDTSLELTRGSAAESEQVASNGVWNRSMDPQQLCPMLRLFVPEQHPVFPEVSGGKHRITLRFLEQPDINERARQTNRTVPFSVVLCTL